MNPRMSLTDLRQHAPADDPGHRGNQPMSDSRRSRCVSSSQSEPCAIDRPMLQLGGPESARPSAMFARNRDRSSPDLARQTESLIGWPSLQLRDRSQLDQRHRLSATLSGPGKSLSRLVRHCSSSVQLSRFSLNFRLLDSSTPDSVLRPPRLGGGLADDDVFEELDGAGEAFVDAHQRVLVLDGDGAVVAGETQLTDQ